MSTTHYAHLVYAIKIEDVHPVEDILDVYYCEYDESWWLYSVVAKSEVIQKISITQDPDHVKAELCKILDKHKITYDYESFGLYLFPDSY